MVACYNLGTEVSAMPEWLEITGGFVVGVVAVNLVLRYRDRSWMKKWRSHV